MASRASRYAAVLAVAGVLSLVLMAGVVRADTSTFTCQLSQTAHIPYMPMLSLRAGGLAMADLNGDDRIDVVLPGLHIAGIDLILNGVETWINTGPWPAAVVAADLSGDGHVDIAVVEQNAGGVAVYTNDGTGAMTRTTFCSTGNATQALRPVAVVVADFDRDGKPDLVVANRAASTVAVLHNTGAGFLLQQTVAVPGEPNALAAADFDNDAWQDVAVACASDDTVKVLKNTGGVLSLAGTFDGGPYPVAVAVADLNGDGFVDMAAADREAPQVMVLLSDGAGAFSSREVLLVPAGYSVFDPPADVQLVDTNFDGKIDIRCAGQTLLNDGAANFSILQSNPWPGAVYAKALLSGEPCEFLAAAYRPAGSTNVISVTYNVAGDVTGDGHVDVEDLLTLVYTFGLNIGDPGFDAAADINKDSSVDVVDLLLLVEHFGV
jgi:hypothetical protein